VYLDRAHGGQQAVTSSRTTAAIPVVWASAVHIAERAKELAARTPTAWVTVQADRPGEVRRVEKEQVGGRRGLLVLLTRVRVWLSVALLWLVLFSQPWLSGVSTPKQMPNHDKR
jgi:hypothetical protein